MSLLFTDSFDHQANGLPVKWDRPVLVSNGSPSIESGGANATNGLHISGGADSSAIQLLGRRQSLIFGFAAKLVTRGRLWTLTQSGSEQVHCSFQADGALAFSRAGTTLGISAHQVPLHSYQYMEFRVDIGTGVAGNIYTRINGGEFFDLTALNTQATSSAYATQLYFGDTDSTLLTSLDFTIDDFYVIDPLDGVAPTDFLGHVRISALVANGPGNYTDWAIGGSLPAPTNWQSVDETSPDDAVTYVSTAVASTRDSYSFSALPTTNGVVKGVGIWPRVRKLDSGTRKLKSLVRNGGVDALGAETAISSDWAWLPTFMATDPASGLTPTLSDINASEWGVELTT